MAEFVAYARALRREIDGFLAATRLRVTPSLALVDCGCQPRHFVPAASLAAHTRKCHGHRYYEAHTSHKFFYPSEQTPPSAITSHSTTTLDGITGDEDSESLVEPVNEVGVDDTAELATSDASRFIAAIQVLATHAAALYAAVQPWRRVPRAFVRLPLGDNGSFNALVKPKLQRWIKAELARCQEATAVNDDDVDSELVEYVLGLLDHPEFCHPDLIAVELEEFIGAVDVKAFVLALWKFVIVEIGIHVLPTTAPPDALTVTNQPKSNGNLPVLEQSKTEGTGTADRMPALKRRRPTYRAKSTRAGPYDMVREILSNSMAQLSEETGRELATMPVVATHVDGARVMDTSTISRTRTPVENWSEYTDPLLVRDMARRTERREKNRRDDRHDAHRRQSRSPPSRSYHRDRRRPSRSRSRSRSRERSSHGQHSFRRDRESSHHSRERRSHDRSIYSGDRRYEDQHSHRRSPSSRYKH